MSLMKSLIAKRSIVIDGHKTSVSLEDAFWSTLKEIANERNETLPQLIAKIDKERQQGNLSSAIRLFVLGRYRQAPTDATVALRGFALVQHCDADRDGDAAEMLASRALHQFLGHHGAPDVVGDRERGAQRGARKDDGEFLAAVACSDVLAFDVLLHREGDETQHLIAGEMAERVVERLEVVDVG